MIDFLAAMAAALLAVQAEPAGETPSGAEESFPPASEGLVDRFLAAIPQSSQFETEDRSIDPAELERLAELNPGRIDEIRPILESQAACEAPLRREMNVRTMRRVADSLGDEKLGRLIRFYEGEDFRTFNRLGGRRNGGESLSESEQAELDRIMSAYPLAEFTHRIQTSFGRFVEDPAMDAMFQCEFDRSDALERRGLRLYPEPEA